MEGDAFWSEEQSFNILESYDKNIMRIFGQFHEDIFTQFHNV